MNLPVADAIVNIPIPFCTFNTVATADDTYASETQSIVQVSLALSSQIS